MNRTRVLFLFSLLLVLAAGAVWRWAPQFGHRPSENATQLLEPASASVSTPGPLRAPTHERGATLTRAGVLHWTNVSRASEGRKPLAEHTLLNTAAERKLADMFARQYFAHDNPDGEGVATIVTAVGYAYLRVGENLALGDFASDQALVDAWMESPGHRANILEPRFTEIGVAVGREAFQGQQTWLSVQVFALPTSACPAVDQALRRRIDGREQSLEALGTDIQEDRKRIGELKAEHRALPDEIARFVAEGNAKIEEGNREIEEGNRIYRETGDREAAQPHWERGERLQAEGRKLHEEARVKQEKLRTLTETITKLVDEANEQVAAFNELREELARLIAKLNGEIQAFNACLGLEVIRKLGSW